MAAKSTNAAFKSFRREAKVLSKNMAKTRFLGYVSPNIQRALVK